MRLTLKLQIVAWWGKISFLGFGRDSRRARRSSPAAVGQLLNFLGREDLDCGKEDARLSG
jgi:hypothetical protein